MPFPIKKEQRLKLFPQFIWTTFKSLKTPNNLNIGSSSS